MIKDYCDRCGKEADTFSFEFWTQIGRSFFVRLLSDKLVHAQLCQECYKKLNGIADKFVHDYRVHKEVKE